MGTRIDFSRLYRENQDIAIKSLREGISSPLLGRFYEELIELSYAVGKVALEKDQSSPEAFELAETLEALGKLLALINQDKAGVTYAHIITFRAIIGKYVETWQTSYLKRLVRRNPPDFEFALHPEHLGEIFTLVNQWIILSRMNTETADDQTV